MNRVQEIATEVVGPLIAGFLCAPDTQQHEMVKSMGGESPARWACRQAVDVAEALTKELDARGY